MRSAVLGTLALLACDGGQGAVAFAEAQQAISNGAPATDPAVVGVATSGSVYCTGVLVSPRVVLTAAHCAPPQAELSVFFGDDAADGGRFVGVLETRLHPDYGLEAPLSSRDLAMLLLAERSDVAPVPLSPYVNPAGVDVRIVGFGQSSGDEAVSFRKLWGTARVAAVEPYTMHLDPAPSQPCRGDSGGPALLGDALLGITSSGDPACTLGSTEARVDAFRDTFIDPYLRATRDGFARAGEVCRYDANCGEGRCLPAADDPLLSTCVVRCDPGCPRGLECVAGECRQPLPTPGAFAGACVEDSDCREQRCVDHLFCSRRCFPDDPASCPEGYACEAQVCKPDAIRGGCETVATVPLQLAVILLARRRRR